MAHRFETMDRCGPIPYGSIRADHALSPRSSRTSTGAPQPGRRTENIFYKSPGPLRGCYSPGTRLARKRKDRGKCKVSVFQTSCTRPPAGLCPNNNKPPDLDMSCGFFEQVGHTKPAHGPWLVSSHEVVMRVVVVANRAVRSVPKRHIVPVVVLEAASVSLYNSIAVEQ